MTDHIIDLVLAKAGVTIDVDPQPFLTEDGRTRYRATAKASDGHLITESCGLTPGQARFIVSTSAERSLRKEN